MPVLTGAFRTSPISLDLLQHLKVILNALIVLRLLRLAGPVDRGCVGQFPSPGKRLKTNPTRNTVSLTEGQWPPDDSMPIRLVQNSRIPQVDLAKYVADIEHAVLSEQAVDQQSDHVTEFETL